MIFPPMWFRIKIRQTGGHNFGLWLPLFLIWPIVLVLAILLFPFVLIVSIFQLLAGRRKLLILIFPRFCSVICALRGMKVDVQSPDETVYVVFK